MSEVKKDQLISIFTSTTITSVEINAITHMCTHRRILLHYRKLPAMEAFLGCSHFKSRGSVWLVEAGVMPVFIDADWDIQSRNVSCTY